MTCRHTSVLAAQAVPVAVRDDADVRQRAQQVQRQLPAQPGAGRRGGPPVLQAAGDHAVPARRQRAGALGYFYYVNCLSFVNLEFMILLILL